MTTESLLAALPQPIALVGNAATPHPFGRLIDRYPTVIRMNNFRIEGHEDRVGSKTDYRCVTGWHDVEQRNEHPEFTPFTADAVPESSNLERYSRENDRPVASAATDVHPFIPEVANPSAGFALVQLLCLLGIPADLFCFDGFRTGHYWNPGAPARTTHSQRELAWILDRGNVLLFNDVYDYEALYDYCHGQHPGYSNNVGLEVARRLDLRFADRSVLELGAGNGALAAHLEELGNRVTAVEISRVAFERIRCRNKLHGGTLCLPLLDPGFDLFLAIDVLEHLAVNDVRMVVRQAARLCSELIVTVSTRPSGLLGPARENLHLTVQPPEWWDAMLSTHFDVQTYEGFFDRQYLIVGTRREVPAPSPPLGSRFPAAAREEQSRPGRVHGADLVVHEPGA